jgi:hypothetical protein
MQIDMLLIESNELQTLNTDPQILALAVQLQNKSNAVQAWPMIELVLKDNRKKTVLQKVFAPSEYLDNKADYAKGIAPISEVNLKLHFELRDTKASGYDVGIFYR